MTPNKDQILQLINQNKETLRRFGVRRIGLFGSFARNQSTDASDLDFLVELERKTFDAYIGLKSFLESLFSRRVDLVLSESLKPRLRQKVFQEVIYAPGL